MVDEEKGNRVWMVETSEEIPGPGGKPIVSRRNIYAQTLGQDPLCADRLILHGVINLKHPLSGGIFKVNSWSLEKSIVLNYYYGEIIDDDNSYFIKDSEEDDQEEDDQEEDDQEEDCQEEADQEEGDQEEDAQEEDDREVHTDADKEPDKKKPSGGIKAKAAKVQGFREAKKKAAEQKKAVEEELEQEGLEQEDDFDWTFDI